MAENLLHKPSVTWEAQRALTMHRLHFFLVRAHCCCCGFLLLGTSYFSIQLSLATCLVNILSTKVTRECGYLNEDFNGSWQRCNPSVCSIDCQPIGVFGLAVQDTGGVNHPCWSRKTINEACEYTFITCVQFGCHQQRTFLKCLMGKSLNTEFPEAKTGIWSKLCVLASVTFTGISGAAVVTFNVSASLQLITADQTAPSAIRLVPNTSSTALHQ